jgi:hypothetical protein
MKYLKRFNDVNEGLFDLFKSKPKKDFVEFKHGEVFNQGGVEFMMKNNIKIEKELFDMAVQKVVSLSKNWVLINNQCFIRVGRNVGSRTEYNDRDFPVVIMMSFDLSDGDEGQIPLDIREEIISNVKNSFKGLITNFYYNSLKKNPILFDISLCKAPKGLNEAVLSPSELIDTGELYTKVKNYVRWEDMIYPVGLKNIEPVDQKDAELITDLVRRLSNAMGHRLIATINVVKRYYQDEIDSALSFTFKGEKGWMTDDHMIFYKFKDEWWAVEAKILGDYSYYVCDGYEGLSKLMNDLTSKWKPKALNESKDELFWKISEDEHDDIEKFPTMDFDLKVLDKIKKLGIKLDVHFEIKRVPEYNSYLHIEDSRQYPEQTYEVSQTEDDYFLVNNNEYEFFQCDSFEGLVEYLKQEYLIETTKLNESKLESNFKEITNDQYSLKVWGATEEGSDEETEWIKDHWDKFEPQEITKIANILYTGRWIANINQDFRPSNKEDIDYLVEDEYLSDDPAEGCSLKFLSPNYKPNETWIYSHLVITKLKDEWFYLYYKPPGQRYHQNDVMYLECDQWSGLIDCLNRLANLQIL